MLPIFTKISAPLEPQFTPAHLWNQAFRKAVAAHPGARKISLRLERTADDASVFDTVLFPDESHCATLNFFYVERLLKNLLWLYGGARIGLYGAPELVKPLNDHYGPSGLRAFDGTFMGEKVYRRPFVVEESKAPFAPQATNPVKMGRYLNGCRIGFDLGGSDRKVAAVVNGRVVFSEETAWSPYFQKDPSYHLEGIHDSLTKAAAHLPRVDAIGGSAAGVYVDGEPRIASLFRGVSPEDFEKHIRPMFQTLRHRWGGIPFYVMNDGEVTALAGSMAQNENAVLGISMGTSMAGGYVTPEGNLTPWLNEVAFAPVDYHPVAAVDEWSGDRGCGVQYFSQQAVNRYALAAGIQFPPEMALPDRLVEVQGLMKKGDSRAAAIYETIGVTFGYSLLHYADYYELQNVLVLGRVTSGPGGEHLLASAVKVVASEAPELASRLKVRSPDENEKRHGQAIAAASLPSLLQTS